MRKQGRSALMLAVLSRDRRGVVTTAGPAGGVAPGDAFLILRDGPATGNDYLDNLKVVLIAMIIAIHGAQLCRV